MKICYLLNHPNDIPWPRLLAESLPQNVFFEILIMDFYSNDFYNWSSKLGKGKSLSPCINKKDIEGIFESYKSLIKKNIKVTHVTSVQAFSSITNDRNYDVAISRGKEFFIFPEFSKKSIALSMDRCHFARLIFLLPYYKNLKIFLQSEEWFKEERCENFNLNFFGKTITYDQLEKIRGSFEFVDIVGCYHEITKKIGKKEIRNQIGLESGQKIALVNFRKAEPAFTTHKTNEEFFKSSIENIVQLKNAGYTIVTRERTDKENISWDASRGLGNSFEKISHLVDLKVNSHSGFPSDVWKVVYASDLLLTMDVSGLCTKEALTCEIPMIMPYNDYFLEKINNFADTSVNPVFKDLIRENGICKSYSSFNASEQQKNLKKIKKRWYNTDINLFWKKVLS